MLEAHPKLTLKPHITQVKLIPAKLIQDDRLPPAYF